VSKRTDIHRPSISDPAEYTFIGEGDQHPDEGYETWEPGWDGDRATQASIVGNYQYRGRCDSCGAGPLRYWVAFEHKDGEVVTVGEKCASDLDLDKRSDLDRRRAREAAYNRAQAERTAAHLARWRAEDPENERAYADLLAREDEAGGSGGRGNDFVDSLLSYSRKYGGLSEKQRDAVLRGIAKREERAAEAANDPDPAPVVEGRIVIEGRVLSLREQDSDFGTTLKQLVLDDRGFKVWGTSPAAIEFQVARGDRVRFTATVTASNDDPTFGFYKRPTKAENITPVKDAESGEGEHDAALLASRQAEPFSSVYAGSAA
jgi:hypothetical protein